jgi:hypothetical protein
MNIRVVPGLSCSLYRLDCFGPLISRRKARDFWWSYLVGGDCEYDLTRFLYLTRAGQVMHYEVTLTTRPLARFGVEYSLDERGAYITVLYMEGQWIAEYLHQLMWTLFSLARAIVPEGVEPRCRVKGRKGWPRYLRRHGIETSDSGMISGWQDYFGFADGNERKEYFDG